jgi:hypothetical protein
LKRDVELNLLRCVVSLSPPTTHPPTPTPLGFSMNPDRQQTLNISVICCPLQVLPQAQRKRQIGGLSECKEVCSVRVLHSVDDGEG